MNEQNIYLCAEEVVSLLKEKTLELVVPITEEGAAECAEAGVTRGLETLCEYGPVGSVLKVMEPWGEVPTAGGSAEVVYAADYGDGSDLKAGVRYNEPHEMPEDFSRLSLEVLSISAEKQEDVWCWVIMLSAK